MTDCDVTLLVVWVVVVAAAASEDDWVRQKLELDLVTATFEWVARPDLFHLEWALPCKTPVAVAVAVAEILEQMKDAWNDWQHWSDDDEQLHKHHED